MKLHGYDPLKAARKNTVLTIVMAAGICSVLFFCMFMGNGITSPSADNTMIAEIK